MTTLLNIGLAREGKKALNSLEVIQLLEFVSDGQLLAYTICLSDSEKTLVARLPTEILSDAFLYALAVVLGQDCIAALDGETSGRLCGPKADKWQPFDGSKFLTLEGVSL